MLVVSENAKCPTRFFPAALKKAAFLLRFWAARHFLRNPNPSFRGWLIFAFSFLLPWPRKFQFLFTLLSLFIFQWAILTYNLIAGAGQGPLSEGALRSAIDQVGVEKV